MRGLGNPRSCKPTTIITFASRFRRPCCASPRCSGSRSQCSFRRCCGAPSFGRLCRGPAMTAALQFRNLTLGYDRHPAVHHLTGSVADGALLAVIGPNGAGKSTLLKGIVGVLPPLDGAIERTQVKREDIAYLPQIAEIDRTFPITVYDLVAMGLWRRAGLFGGISRNDRDEIEKAI